MARRLDRDVAVLERHTKQLDGVAAVAVENQKGRYPKKWDKTGVVVENMDHDKVLVRMDGSRRLTTRNRRFVKKIISPRDLPDQNVVQNPSVPDMLGAADKVPTAQVDLEDMDDGVGEQSGVQQQGMEHYEAVQGGGEIFHEEQSHLDNHEVPVAEDRVDNQTRSPVRPQRTRKPNVRYSQEEYDLSNISAHIRQAGISGMSVKQVNTKDRQVLWSPETWG